MYIICNKIRVICSKIRVGMEGGPFSIGGGPYSMGRILWNMDPRVHIQWGSIFNLTPALLCNLAIASWVSALMHILNPLFCNFCSLVKLC